MILGDLYANCKYIIIYGTHDPYFVGIIPSKYGKADGSKKLILTHSLTCVHYGGKKKF